MGILFSLFSCFFFLPAVKVSLFLLIPMVVDGFSQRLTSYESNNRRRFITGFMFGYGLFALFVVSTKAAFDIGLDIGRFIRQN